MLVPLVAIDGSGTRLGRGKGHYDRALLSLKKNGARLIGVGWAMQRLTEEIPGDAWDVPLDGFASPDGLELFEPPDVSRKTQPWLFIENSRLRHRTAPNSYSFTDT